MLRAGILAATVALLGGAVYLLVQGDAAESEAPRAAAESEAPEDEEAKIREAPGGRGRVSSRPPRAGRSTRPQLEARTVVEPPPIVDDPLRPKDAAEVVSRFEAHMAALEALTETSKTLSVADKERLYRESTDMLAAMTEQFDLRDPEQRRYLEEARALLLAQLRNLGVGPPTPPDRPSRSPNPPPQ